MRTDPAYADDEIDLLNAAYEALKKFDRPTQLRILDYLEKRLDRESEKE